ncbi:TolC family protein [Flavobacterium sp.]|uniref:TolC family protein n=1 Tax=Flavobacterium sp. TaxID=239 RepID=UPI003451F94F
MSVHDAVAMALEKSDAVGLAKAKVETKKFEKQVVQNNQYPDVKLSGQYMRLTNANINIKSQSNSNSGSTSGASKPVNQLMLGQANVGLPLFSGFKLKNSIDASEHLYQSEVASAEHSKSETAIQVIEYYAALYKAQQTVELLKESLKSSQQRVTDFTALEQNGIIARNDLLKSQLQVSRIQLNLDEAEKNLKMINFRLITLLKMNSNTQVVVSPSNIDPNLFNNLPKTEAEAIEKRDDVASIRSLEKASESEIKVAKSGYYPALSLSAGYIALDIQNALTVSNAMNVGVGVSYNLSSLFKNGKDVKVAKSKAIELQKQEAELTDAVKIQIKNAQEDYELAVKQDKVYSESVIQSSENFRIVKDKYENGLSNTNDLLEADVDALSAKINLANAKANVALKYYELLNTTGQLLESFNLSKN